MNHNYTYVVQIYTYVLYVTHAYILYVCTGPGVQDCLFTWMSSTSLPGAADHASRRRQGQSAEGAAVHRAEGDHPSQCQKNRIGFYHVLPAWPSFMLVFVAWKYMHIFFDFLQIITIRSYDIQSYTDCFFGIIATRDLGITNQTSFDVGGNHLLGCGPVTWMDCLDGHNSLV